MLRYIHDLFDLNMLKFKHWLFSDANMYNAVMSIVGMWKEKGITYHYVATNRHIWHTLKYCICLINQMCSYWNTLHFLSIFNQTYVVGTCNHTDVEKPNHPASMGPTHTPTILLCTFKVFHAFPPVQQTWTTMTWLPSPCRLGDMVLPSPAAWQVRSAQRHFGHQRDLATGQSRKQLNTRPSLATVASAVLPVHFFHNNDNQHAAWRGLCSYCRGNEGGKNGFNNSAMIGRESELWTGWLNNNPQDSNPRPHCRGSVVWTNYAMPYPLCNIWMIYIYRYYFIILSPKVITTVTNHVCTSSIFCHQHTWNMPLVQQVTCIENYFCKLCTQFWVDNCMMHRLRPSTAYVCHTMYLKSNTYPNKIT